MGNCQSRLCCTANSPETTPPKTARSEKSANLEMNSCNTNSERFFPYSVSDRFNRINELCEKELTGWRELHSMMAEKAEELRRAAHGVNSATKNVCDDDPNQPSCAAIKEIEDYTETATENAEEVRRAARGVKSATKNVCDEDLAQPSYAASKEIIEDYAETATENAEEVRRATRSVKSATKNVCDEDLAQPSYAASKKVEDYTETATKSKKVDEETRIKFLRQLHRTTWKDVNQRIMKAREVALARMENGGNQGAPTPAESSSCNVPSREEWLINHPCLFDAIVYSENDNDDEENCSQSSATGHVAISVKLNMFFSNKEPEEPSEEPEFDSNSPGQELDAEIAESKPEAKEGSTSNCSILFMSTDHQPSTKGHDDRTRSSGPGPSPCPSPRPGALTRILKRRRNNSVAGLVSNSGSEAEESVRTQEQTPTPSPEDRADSRRGGFLRGVYSRIAQRRRNRVRNVKSPGKSQSSSNSAIHSNPKSSNDRAFQSTPQTSNRSSLTRAWLNILGRSPPPTSGRVTHIFVRSYDESQAENGRRPVPSPASVELNTSEEVSVRPSPIQSSTSGIVTFQVEDDIEVCSFTSSPTFDARSTDSGGT